MCNYFNSNATRNSFFIVHFCSSITLATNYDQVGDLGLGLHSVCAADCPQNETEPRMGQKLDVIEVRDSMIDPLVSLSKEMNLTPKKEKVIKTLTLQALPSQLTELDNLDVTVREQDSSQVKSCLTSH